MKYDHAFFLNRAFKLAQLGRFTTSPNPNVGCVIVRDGCIVGEGYHKRTGESHAEIKALTMAGKNAKGATTYVTLEPCSHQGHTPPCVNALINAGIKKVVSAMSDPNPKVSGRGFEILKKAGIKVINNIMLSKAEELNKGFIKRMRTGLPLIRLKIAMSLDGRTAMSSGESKWITSLESRKDVHNWRAESDAILSTSSTILKDNPSLSVKWNYLSKEIQDIYHFKNLRQPIKIIIDSTNRINPNYKIISNKDSNIILARLKLEDHNIWPKFVEQVKLPSYKIQNIKYINLSSLMVELGHRQINNVWVEAGASLSGALIKNKLIDELIIYQAPKILGSDSRPLCLLSKLKCISNALQFKLIDLKKINDDIFLRFIPKKNINTKIVSNTY